MARAVAFQRLDLDDLGAHIAQHHATGRAHHHMGELDDAQAFKRQALALAVRRIHSNFQFVDRKGAAKFTFCANRPAGATP